MIPVTVLTGFLGSGKTTILAEVLRRPEFARTAVIVNEFGEIGIDHDLIETSEESVVQLTTGCLCCIAHDDLALTFADLIARRDRADVPPFDRVVVETSGLADPAPIIHALIRVPTIARRFKVERVVVTVDVLTALNAFRTQQESIKQVALADRILLTKSDVEAGSVEAVTKNLRRYNHTAPVMDRWQCDDVVEYLFGNDFPGSESGRDYDEDASVPFAESIKDGPSSDHADVIQSVTLVRDAPLAAVAVTLFLEALAAHCGGDLLRLKGLIKLRESPNQPYVLHGVQHVFHAPIWLDTWPGSDRRSRLVLLGRGISARWADALLTAICHEVDEVEKDEMMISTN